MTTFTVVPALSIISTRTGHMKNTPNLCAPLPFGSFHWIFSTPGRPSGVHHIVTPLTALWRSYSRCKTTSSHHRQRHHPPISTTARTLSNPLRRQPTCFTTLIRRVYVSMLTIRTCHAITSYYVGNFANPLHAHAFSLADRHGHKDI